MNNRVNLFFTYLSRPCHNHQHCILLLYGIIFVFCLVHKKGALQESKTLGSQTVQKGLKNDPGYMSNYKRRQGLRLDCVEQTRGYKISSWEIKRSIPSASEENHSSVAQLL